MQNEALKIRNFLSDKSVDINEDERKRKMLDNFVNLNNLNLVK